jgi:DNA-binding MltR family transcriptional regulator
MKSNECGKVLRMDRYEYGVVIEGLVKLHNSLIHDNRPHDFVDEVLLKTMDALEQKVAASEMER